MPITLIQRPIISAGEIRNVRVNFTDELASTVSLTGTPTVTEVTTTALTITNTSVNATTYLDSVTDETVAVGKAVQCTVQGGVSGTAYTLRVTVSTNSTPAETLVRDLILTFT